MPIFTFFSRQLLNQFRQTNKFTTDIHKKSCTPAKCCGQFYSGKRAKMLFLCNPKIPWNHHLEMVNIFSYTSRSDISKSVPTTIQTSTVCTYRQSQVLRYQNYYSFKPLLPDQNQNLIKETIISVYQLNHTLFYNWTEAIICNKPSL